MITTDDDEEKNKKMNEQFFILVPPQVSGHRPNALSPSALRWASEEIKERGSGGARRLRKQSTDARRDGDGSQRRAGYSRLREVRRGRRCGGKKEKELLADSWGGR